MTNRNIILDSLVSCLGNESVLVIHSSLANFKLENDINKWDFLYSLRSLVSQGRTIAIPAFTFSFCEKEDYHFKKKSEVGVLADWAKLLPEFHRTDHPIYSYMVAGPESNKIFEANNSTTFGDDSYLAFFEKLNARIVMFGCGWEYCTQFHRYEEKAKVPYRKYKTFYGSADYGQGKQSIQSVMFVRRLDIEFENNFQPVIDELRSDNLISSTSLFGGIVESVTVHDLAKKTKILLTEDPCSLIMNGEKVSESLKQRALLKNKKPLKVALMGDSNLSLISKELEKSLGRTVTDQFVELYVSDYGQNRQDILNIDSKFNIFSPDFIFFVNRLEDLVGDLYLDGLDVNVAEELVGVYIETILELRNLNNGIIFVAYFPLLFISGMGYADLNSNNGVYKLIVKLNEILKKSFSKYQDIYLFDMQSHSAYFSNDMIVDSRLWMVGRYPFSSSFSELLGERLSALVLAATGRTVRLIVVDLDNTLWGGVLGEDGKKSLAVGGDYPGNSYYNFQRVLKSLSQRGIALSICSKNDEKLALNAIRCMSKMVLQLEDFVSHRINWLPKWKNILSICEEINVGIGSVLFIDDNPAEREQVRQKLPEVKVLDLPDDPAKYAEVLLRSPWIENLNVTEEDGNRTENYKNYVVYKKQKSNSNSLIDFYSSLKTILYFNHLDEGNHYRALQLINKTNQFNTTTMRHTSGSLDKLIRNGREVIVIAAEDKFSQLENIGILIVHWGYPEGNSAMIDSYLLSCRTLGRGLESAVLYWLINEANKNKMKYLMGKIIDSDRNTPVREVYLNSGFSKDEVLGLWKIDVQNDNNNIPDWLSIKGNYKKRGVNK